MSKKRSQQFWTRKPCCRKETARCRRLAVVLLGLNLKFADNIHYKFNSSQKLKLRKPCFRAPNVAAQNRTPGNILTSHIRYCQNLESLGWATSSSLIASLVWVYLHSNFGGRPRKTHLFWNTVLNGMALQGHPRSLILAPIESAYATSYWSSIVTLVYVAPFQRYCRFPAENDPTDTVFPVPPLLRPNFRFSSYKLVDLHSPNMIYIFYVLS